MSENCVGCGAPMVDEPSCADDETLCRPCAEMEFLSDCDAGSLADARQALHLARKYSDELTQYRAPAGAFDIGAKLAMLQPARWCGRERPHGVRCSELNGMCDGCVRIDATRIAIIAHVRALEARLRGQSREEIDTSGPRARNCRGEEET